GADPEGSILSGDSPRSYKVEGIGEDFIPKTFNRQVVDEMVRVSDKESFNAARRLARLEGMLAGGSSGTALAAALKFAQRLKRPHYIVVILPDTGRNYLSKIFNDVWMQENGFWEGQTCHRLSVGEVLRTKRSPRALISVQPRDKLVHAITTMQVYNISQLPVIDNNQVVGSFSESSIMKLLYDGLDVNNQEISAVMGKPLPMLDASTDVSEAYRILLGGIPGIVVTQEGRVVGFITRADLIATWSSHKTDVNDLLLRSAYEI
ncbi:MAG: pyridoxal-phosphate dependent enzyme, partial [Lentisphaerota bacterium]